MMNDTNKHSTRKLLWIVTGGVALLVALICIFLGVKAMNARVDNWTSVDTDSFQVQIPDGWTVYKPNDSATIVNGDCASCLTYKPGMRAKVTTGDTLRPTEETLFPFFMRAYPSGDTNEISFFKDYEQTGTISARNVAGTTYVKKGTASHNNGLRAGSKIYGYAFTKGAVSVFITHTVGPDGKDVHDTIERMITTLELKKAGAAKTNSQFTFKKVADWRQGPTNKTSMALFYDRADCFVSMQYKSGFVNVMSEQERWQDGQTEQGNTVTPGTVRTLQLQTNEGPKQYQLQQYTLTPGEGSSDPYLAQELGYLQFADGYVKIEGYCAHLRDLPATLPALQAMTFKDLR
jgi:hypothetical protein